jgi:hypothetical protein
MLLDDVSCRSFQFLLDCPAMRYCKFSVPKRCIGNASGLAVRYSDPAYQAMKYGRSNGSSFARKLPPPMLTSEPHRLSGAALPRAGRCPTPATVRPRIGAPEPPPPPWATLPPRRSTSPRATPPPPSRAMPRLRCLAPRLGLIGRKR